MAYVFGIPTLVFLVVIVYGGLTGRIRLSSCCTIADPRKDLRMRGAFEDADLADLPSGSQAPPKPDRR
jgi:hypothetical protein